MKTIPTDLAFPTSDPTGYAVNIGLTKREYFAAMAFQGILSSNGVPSPRWAAAEAIRMADSLIEELNKETK